MVNACTRGAVQAATAKESGVPNFPTSVRGQVRSAIISAIRGSRDLQSKLGLRVGGSKRFDIIISVKGKNISILLQQGSKRVCFGGAIINTLKTIFSGKRISGLYREMNVALTAPPRTAPSLYASLSGSGTAHTPTAVKAPTRPPKKQVTVGRGHAFYSLFMSRVTLGLKRYFGSRYPYVKLTRCRIRIINNGPTSNPGAAVLELAGSGIPTEAKALAALKAKIVEQFTTYNTLQLRGEIGRRRGEDFTFVYSPPKRPQ